MHEDHLIFSQEVYENRKRSDVDRSAAMERYVIRARCRSVQLLEYFGERFPEPCGHCDVCRESKKHGLIPGEIEDMQRAIDQLVLMHEVTLEELPERLTHFNRHHLLEFVRWKIDKGELVLTDKLVLALPDME